VVTAPEQDSRDAADRGAHGCGHQHRQHRERYRLRRYRKRHAADGEQAHAGTVAKETTKDALGITEWTLSNGVRSSSRRPTTSRTRSFSAR
jgi:hypothetical protein